MIHVYCVLSLTETRDLRRVLLAITKVVRWIPLGLALGLEDFTLETINKQNMGRIEECKTQMLSAWLRQKDDAVDEALPTWSALEAALREIGENTVAKELWKCQ